MDAGGTPPWMEAVEPRLEQRSRATQERLPRRPVSLRRRVAICTQAGVVTIAPLVQTLPSRRGVPLS
jgi:hypothetical protein